MRPITSAALASTALPLLRVCLALLLAGPVAAEWYVTRITDTAEDSRRPSVTFDTSDDLHLFWEEAGEIRHLLHAEGGFGPVELVGTGAGFDRWTCLS